MLDRKHSEETRAKMSETRKDIIMYSEDISKLGLFREGKDHPFFGKKSPMFGKKHSEETRTKLSVANKGEKNPMFGRKVVNSYNDAKSIQIEVFDLYENKQTIYGCSSKSLKY